MKEKHCITISFPSTVKISHLYDEENKINTLIFETDNLNWFRDLEFKFISASHSVKKFLAEKVEEMKKVYKENA